MNFLEGLRKSKMLPKFHVLVGFIFSLILYLVFPGLSLIGIGIFFFSSFLIDFDHYLLYVFEKKNFNLKKAYFWFKNKGKKFSKIPKKERKNYSFHLSYFHGLEWIILFLVLGYFFSNYFYFVAAGMLFHLFFDWVSSYKSIERVIKFSIFFDYFNNKKLKEL